MLHRMAALCFKRVTCAGFVDENHGRIICHPAIKNDSSRVILAREWRFNSFPLPDRLLKTWRVAYNLTETQKKLARFLVEQVKAGHLSENFHAEESSMPHGEIILSDGRFSMPMARTSDRKLTSFKTTLGALDALAAAKMIIQEETHGSLTRRARLCTLTGLIYEAVASNFAEPSPIMEATERARITTYVPNTAFIMMWM